MESYTHYDNSGKIIQSGVVSDVDINDMPYPRIPEYTEDFSTNYVYNGIITNKPTNTTTIDKVTCLSDGVDFITLSSIPDNATITISGQGVNINQSIGNSDTITFDLAGEYSLRIESFPSLDYEVIINAT